jgi:CRISPR-associated protein (TIGR03986 family)
MSASPFVEGLPLQTNPTDDQRKSRAPYNFVPLPERVVRAVDSAEELPRHDRFSTEGYPHSGWFEVEFKTETPLYIRAPLRAALFANPVENGSYTQLTKNTPDFFHRGEDPAGNAPRRPVIPGSSLRGMLRSLVEIIGYGKMTQVLDRPLVYRAVGDTTSLGGRYRTQTLGPNKNRLPALHFDYPSSDLRGGFLCKHNGDWAIRPGRCDAATHHESFVHVEIHTITANCRGQETCNVFVMPAPRRPTGRSNPNLTLDLALTDGIVGRTPGMAAPAGMLPAVLVQSARIAAKHMQCAIFEPDPASLAVPIPIPSDKWDNYVDDRDLHRGDGRGARRLEREGDALFYLVDGSGKLVFFGPTMMFRLPYRNSPLDLIPKPLRRPLDIDLADAVFGYIRRKDDFKPNNPPSQGDPAWAYAGRVSVSDAHLAPDQSLNDLFLQELTPAILSTPKPTTFQHYLVQPEQQKEALSHFDSPTEDAEGNLRGVHTVLRGTKLYWHRGQRTRNQLHQQDVQPNSTQHTRMRPISAGKRFIFRVRFDNLSDVELGALCWALHPHGHESRQYRHHLGMGKPLGMGSIQLTARLTLTDRRARYRRLFEDGKDDWARGCTTTRDLGHQNDLKALVDPFERCILTDLGIEAKGHRLAELRRIGNLLKLMEWPGPNAAQTEGWSVQNDGWEAWKQRRVLPPPPAFGLTHSTSSPPRPDDAGMISRWPPVPEQSFDPIPPVAPGTQVDLKEYMTEQQNVQRLEARRKLLAEIEHWEPDQVVNQLGGNDTSTGMIEQFEGQEADLIRAIAARHQETLQQWATFKGGKKLRAYNTFQDWLQRFGGLD